MQYAPDEIRYNNAAYLEAAANLGAGGDILPTYLKMALPYDRKSVDEWMEVKISFNSEAFINWYAREGNDYTTVVDDLDPNGVEWLFEEIVE